MPSDAASLPPSAEFEVRHNALGRLELIDGAGRRHEDVEPIRAFPISDPDRGISICDRDGHELYWIDHLSALSPAVRAVLEADLSQREFIPVVRRIVRMAAFSEPSEWVVETDRGQTQFLLGNEEDVHRIDAKRAMIVDTNGVRYLIADIGALDGHSRRILERYL
ncbi:MAG TPA: DUF1854 domain-containing protein [Pirellulales bacterium]|nr:DUF1854 domain-containing protein [Pirellulales bacterium]